MKKPSVLPIVSFPAVVVGSGAAGLAAACLLKEKGVDCALMTERMNSGTSRNTGSDKQTYHRLSLLDGDSVDRMAADLFAGGAVDGDNALCEASLSVPCFDRLCSLGVPFPHNEFGEYPGYRTDHSETRRATSAGPLTSKYMTEAWEKQLRRLSVPVLDHHLVVRLTVRENRILGLIALDTERNAYLPVRTPFVVWATGGPAAVFERRVYPESHRGSLGVPLAAGAAAQNLTEWQFGLASTGPVRWNLSGSYQQVLPRILCDGNELLDWEPERVWQSTFLKGYQWPFDPRKIPGSSEIDLAVSAASAAGKQVFLDFTANPCREHFSLSRLPEEVRSYLENSGAVGDTPAERLKQMNPEAYDLYRRAGLELDREPLPVAVCAQHCNGGLSVDADWQTGVDGLYAAGEAAGTHGIYRPGGSALNAGQVGAVRAAESIARRAVNGFYAPEYLFEEEMEQLNRFTDSLGGSGRYRSLKSLEQDTARRMSDSCSVVRDPGRVRETGAYLLSLGTEDFCPTPEETAADLFRVRDALIARQAVAFAEENYLNVGGGSRGSYLVPGRPVDLSRAGKVQVIRLENSSFAAGWRPVRPVPERNLWFERVWKEYRERENH